MTPPELLVLLVTTCNGDACVTTRHPLGTLLRPDAEQVAETVRREKAKAGEAGEVRLVEDVQAGQALRDPPSRQHPTQRSTP